jgi:hypothetical protein
MVLVAALGLLLAVVVVRETVRGFVQGGPFRVGAVVALAGPGSFRKRVGVIGAGLFATYAAVVALGLGYAATYGAPLRSGFYRVGEVLADGPAVGKLQPGDRIEAVDGVVVRVGTTRSLVDMINKKAGAPVVLSILRDGAHQTIRIEPRPNASGRWLIGIRPTFEAERSTKDALGFATTYPWHHTKRLVRSIARAFEGRGEVRGVVRIVEQLSPYQPAGLVVLLAASTGQVICCCSRCCSI